MSRSLLGSLHLKVRKDLWPKQDYFALDEKSRASTDIFLCRGRRLYCMTTLTYKEFVEFYQRKPLLDRSGGTPVYKIEMAESTGQACPRL